MCNQVYDYVKENIDKKFLLFGLMIEPYNKECQEII